MTLIIRVFDGYKLELKERPDETHCQRLQGIDKLYIGYQYLFKMQMPPLGRFFLHWTFKGQGSPLCFRV